jgi:hypothetical protein
VTARDGSPAAIRASPQVGELLLALLGQKVSATIVIRVARRSMPRLPPSTSAR